jgi:hypothetical protein
VKDSVVAAIEAAWTRLVKTRALCPYVDSSAVGMSGYLSPEWYRVRGASYFVNLASPLSEADVTQLHDVAESVNRSFIVDLAAILEERGVVPYGSSPVRSLPGGDHVQLIKWLRNRFAHGDWQYDAGNPRHVETRTLLEAVLPDAAADGPGFVTSIDKALEPLKEGALEYVRATR